MFPLSLNNGSIESTSISPLRLRLASLFLVAASISTLPRALDFGNGTMNVTKSVVQTKKGLRVKATKSEKPRRFAVPAAVLEIFRSHRSIQERDKELFGSDYYENQLVFCRPDGEYYSPDRVGARVVELMRKAGLARCQPSLAKTYTYCC